MIIIRPVIITDAMFISSNLPENDEPVYSAGTTYALGDKVILISTHRIYESLIASNTGNNPPDNLTGETPAWQDNGATNKWRVFDQVVGNQAEHATVLEYEIETGVIVDSMSLQNLDAIGYTVVMTDPTDGVVYDQTYSLISAENVGDRYDYFFEPILQDDAAAIFDLPLYPDATIDISINNGLSPVGCGEIVIGRQRFIGKTLQRPRMGIVDFSKKITDPVTGALEIEEKAYSKTISTGIRMESSATDDIFRLLSLIRATPVVWVAVDDFSSLNVYGFYRDFQMELTYLSHTEYSLEIEGLT